MTEPRWLSWLYLRKPLHATIGDKSLRLGHKDIELFAVSGVHLSKAWFAPNWLGGRLVQIQHQQGLTGFLANKGDAQQLQQAISDAIADRLVNVLDNIAEQIHELAQRHAALYSLNVYVRYSAAAHFAAKEHKCIEKLMRMTALLQSHPMLSEQARTRTQACKNSLTELSPFILSMNEARNAHNRRYVEHWREAEKDFFKSVESSALTEEQIKAALVFEDATVVVAAAGSGKSSCIVGKIGFALKTGLVKDHEVLALAYNGKAAESLQTRLDQKLTKALKRPVAVTSKTFHSFGLATLGTCHDESYRPKVLKEDEGEEGRFLKKTITRLVEDDTGFQQAVQAWLAIGAYDTPQPVGVAGDLESCAKRFEECCRERLKARLSGDRKPWEPTIPTWKNDIYVRSLEERSIANWLILHGVDFKYEAPDWDGAKRLGLGKTANDKPKPYNPDFSYAVTRSLPNNASQTVRIVHEHFALDAQGHAPQWLGGKKYEEHAQQKRSMYRMWMNESANTSKPVLFFETTSAQMRDGTIWQHLQSNLQQAGVLVFPPSETIQERCLSEFRQSADLEQLIIDFVLRFKESGLTADELNQEAAKSANPYRSTIFVKVALQVFNGYQADLQAQGKIDFADMLRLGIAALKERQLLTPYRFVLVDEFQDISKLKADLVKAVLDQNPQETIVFCVGDDWQTINRFSGSDVRIFKNAGGYLNRHVELLKLTRTFRCSQGIADVARWLVMHNPDQIDKDVEAKSDQVPGCVRIVHHHDDGPSRYNAAIAELQRFANCAAELKLQEPSVQILLRTKADTTAPEGLRSEDLKKITALFRGRLSISMHSVHGSKGLEADFILMPGLDSGFRGFPDVRAPEPLMDLVLPKLSSPVEEERRLMYVGLTRARVMVTILASDIKPSEFVLELEQARQKYAVIDWVDGQQVRVPCPRCHIGSLTKQGRRDQRIVCSRAIACGHVQQPSKGVSRTA